MASKTKIITEFETRGAARTAKETEAVGRAQTRLGQASASAGRQFSAQANGLGGLVGVYAAAAANVFAITAAFEALGRAAQAEQIVRGTKTLALEIGQNGSQILKRVQEITQSQLTLAESSQNINIALSAGFNTQQIEALSEVSLKASRALGRNLTDAFQRVVRGAAKLEPELLDELGIFTRIDPAVREYARSLNISANSLTNFEKRQAFVNAVITEGQRKFSSINVTTGSAQKSLEQLQVALTELALQFGQLLSNFLVPTIDFIKNNAGVALLAFLGILQLVFGRALASIGGFATGGLAKLATFTEGLSAKAQKSSAAVANLTGTIKDFNAAVSQRGGIVGTTGELAGTGAFAAGLTRDTARGASGARKRFREGGVSPVQQAKDIKILTKAQNELTNAGRKNSLAFKDAGTIIETYKKAQKGANAATKTFIGVSQAATLAVKGLGAALRVATGALNILFFAVSGLQLVGTLFDVDLLAEIKDFFFAIRQEALNFEAGLTGAVSAAAGGANDLEKQLKRLGATDKELKELPETINDFAEAARKSSSITAGARGNAQRGAQGRLAAAGFAGSLREFKELSKVQQDLIFLRSELTKQEAEGTQQSRRNVVVLESLIAAFEDIGNSSELIGAISRELNLSNEKTASIFSKITRSTDGVVIKFNALGFSVDTSTQSFANLSEEQQKLIIANTLVENTLNNASDSFKNGTATSDTLSKKLIGVTTELDRLRANAQKLTGDDLLIALGAIADLEKRETLLNSQVRTLKRLETQGKALNDTYGKFSNTLDKAVQEGLIGLNGAISKDSVDIAKNQARFLANAAGFSGANAEAIQEAVKAQKEGNKLEADQVRFVENRETALKSIAGLSLSIAPAVERETKARERTLKTIQQQVKLQKLQNDLQRLQNKLALQREQQTTDQETGRAGISIEEKRLEIFSALNDAAKQQRDFEKDLFNLQAQRLITEEKIADIRANAEAASGQASREAGIDAQKSVIADFQAFPNLRSQEQLIAEQRRLIELELANKLAIIDAQEEQSARAATRELDAVLLQQENIDRQLESLTAQRAFEREQASRENDLRQANQAIELQKLADEAANLKLQDKIAEKQLFISLQQIEADRQKFDLDNKNAQRTLEGIRKQQEIVNAFVEALNSDTNPFVNAIKELVTLQTGDADRAAAIAQSSLSGLDVDFTGLEKLQTQIEGAQEALLGEKTQSAFEKFSSQSDILDEQANRIQRITDLTARRQVIENQLAAIQAQNADKALENQSLLLEQELTNLDGQIDLINEKFAAEQQGYEDARAAAQRNAEEQIRGLERVRKTLGDLGNRVIGNITDGLGSAIELAFDNIAQGGKVTDGMRDLFVSTFENIRKSVLEETLINPIQEKAKEFLGGFFNFGESKGADNAGLVGDALKVFNVNEGGDDQIKDIQEKAGDVFDTIMEKLGDFGSSLGDIFSGLGDTASSIFSSIGSSLSGIMGGIGSGVSGAFSGVSGIFGSIFGGGAATPVPGPMGLASGGTVRRFASGGMNRDRVPALLEPGEFVMKRSAARSIGEPALNAMNATGSGGNVSVNIQNNGSPKQAEASQPRFDGEKFVVDIVMRDLASNGPIRRSLRAGGGS